MAVATLLALGSVTALASDIGQGRGFGGSANPIRGLVAALLHSSARYGLTRNLVPDD